MMIVLRKLAVALLLTSGMAGAFAKPTHNWDEPGPARIERQRQWADASYARRDEGQMQRQERRGGHDDRQYGSGQPSRQGGYGQPPQQGGYAQPSQDDGRQSGRMSPEERRELRRQIDEAGRNIYTPRR